MESWGSPPPLFPELGSGDFDIDQLDLDQLLGLPASSGGPLPDLAVLGAATTPPLRCLDASHPQDCTRCRPAPDEDCTLVAGDARSGNKLLRALVLLTPEWAAEESRTQAALAADAAGLPQLGETLRKRTGRKLVKSWSLFLCRLWGYRSDLWLSTQELRQLKRQRATGGGGAAKRPSKAYDAAAAALVPVPRLPLPPVCDLTTVSLRGFIASQLEPLTRASALAFEGPESRRRTQLDGVAPFLPSALEHFGAMAALGDAMHARWLAAAAGLRAWAGDVTQSRGALGVCAPAEPGTAAAWQLLPYCPTEGAATTSFRELSDILGRAVQMLRANRPEVILGANKAPPPGFTLAQMEYAAALRDGNAFCTASQLLLMQLQAGATLDVYVAGAEALLRAAAAFMADTATAFRRRREWCEHVLLNGIAQPLALNIAPEQNYRTFYGVLLDDCLSADSGLSSWPESAAVPRLLEVRD